MPDSISKAGTVDFETIHNIMKQFLDERERKVIAMHFGLADFWPHKLSEVAENLGLTRERIRQIEFNALSLIRRRFAVFDRDPNSASRSSRRLSAQATDRTVRAAYFTKSYLGKPPFDPGLLPPSSVLRIALTSVTIDEAAAVSKLLGLTGGPPKNLLGTSQLMNMPPRRVHELLNSSISSLAAMLNNHTHPTICHWLKSLRAKVMGASHPPDNSNAELVNLENSCGDSAVNCLSVDETRDSHATLELCWHSQDPNAHLVGQRC